MIESPSPAAARQVSPAAGSSEPRETGWRREWTKPAAFIGVSAGVLVTTVWWANSIAARVNGDLSHLFVFPRLFVAYDRPAAIHVALAFVVALGAARLVPAARFDRMARWIAENPVLFSLLAFVILAAGAYLAYDHYPLALDEFAQYFQAEVFAHGRLSGQYPPGLVRGLLPMPDQFFFFSARTGRVVSGYWPGFPLLLTPFMFLHVPWVANPAVGVVGILLVRHLALKLMPETPQAAGWAMLFMLASPSFSINAISFYSMNAYLTLGLAYAALLLELTPGRLFAAGLVGSFALVQHNPFPHALFAIPWLVWLAIRRDRLRNLSWIGLGYLPLTVGILYGWWVFQRVLAGAPADVAAATESPLRIAATLGGHLGAFGLPDPSILTERALATLKVFLWAVPGLVIIAAWGYWRLRGQTIARLLMLSAAITYAAYFLVVFDQGHGWGDRYFHPAWGVLPLFGAAWVTERREGFRWARLMGSLAAVSLLVLTPVRMMNAHGFIELCEGQAPPRDPSKRQVSFVNVLPGGDRYYPDDAVRNDPFLRNPSIVLMSRGFGKDEQLIHRNYPHAKLVFWGSHGSVWDLNE